MECPKCNQEMLLKKEDLSSDFRSNKQYDRKVYWCESDDVWVNIEVPKVNSK
jgi:hypothetical protein